MTVINVVATVLKVGDRTHLGAVHLATSLVADLQPGRRSNGLARWLLEHRVQPVGPAATEDHAQPQAEKDPTARPGIHIRG